ncbi:MAG: hypothetical protein AMXMBFR12_08320 [Candidatus Babeliales bacterium]
MKNILYLASKSFSRKELLRKAGIPFVVINQDADETRCDWNQQLQKVVETIAIHKMNHAIMPHVKEDAVAFVVTADTLSVDATGAISGKPTDFQDAIAKIKAARGGVNFCGTAFCLERRRYKNGIWETEAQIVKFVHAEYYFEVPDEFIRDYIKHSGALEAAGAITIEDGPQYLKSVSGSYSAIVGLPMYELWQALTELGFF